jgi:hypothetical protein
MTRIGGVSRERFVSFKWAAGLRQDSGAFVSARKNPFPGNRDQFLENWFESAAGRMSKRILVVEDPRDNPNDPKRLG